MAAVVGLDDSMLAAVANANFKTLAEGPIIDAQGHRNRMNAIFEASMGNITSSLVSAQPTVTDAVAQQLQQGGGLAQTIAQLSTAQGNASTVLAQALATAMQLLAAGNAGGNVPAPAK